MPNTIQRVAIVPPCPPTGWKQRSADAKLCVYGQEAVFPFHGYCRTRRRGRIDSSSTCTVARRQWGQVKNEDLQKAADGSLTVYVQADEPKDSVERANSRATVCRV